MYISPFTAIIDAHSIIHHSFADDMQMQMSATADGISELLYSMQLSIVDVKALATANMLKLSENKTDVMLFTSSKLCNSITYRLQSLLEMLNFPSNSQ